MTERETYHMRTEDPDVIHLLKKQKSVQDFLENLLKDFVKNRLHYDTTKDELAKLKLEKLKLDIANGKINLWTNLRQEFPNFTWDQKVKIMNEPLELESPKLPRTQNDFGICDLCGHEHTKDSPSVCKNINCNCGTQTEKIGETS